MELISIIVPVYNVENYLMRCLDSLLGQTYSNTEIILVDDGSTDSSGRICDDYQNKFQNVKVVHKKNGGLSSARNLGIECGSGEFLLFCDSDDYIASNCLDVLYHDITEYNADIAMCGYIELKDGEIKEAALSGDVVKRELLNSDEALSRLCMTGSVGYTLATNKLYRKKVWLDLRFPEGKVNEDAFVMHHVFMNRLLVVNTQCLYMYCRHDNSITMTKSYRSIDMLDAYLDRIKMLETIPTSETKIMKTVRQFWYWAFFVVPGGMPEEKIRRLERIDNYKWHFLKYHFRDNSKTMKERIVLAVYLLLPRIYKILKKY